MSEAEIYQALDGIFAEIFKRPIELKPELAARDVPGWDSFRFVSILMAAEDHFSIKLPPAALDNLANVGDLVHAIAMQVS